MKKIISLVLSILLIASIIPSFSITSLAYSASSYTDNPTLINKLNEIFSGDIDIYSDKNCKTEKSMPVDSTFSKDTNYYVKSNTTGNICSGKQCYIYANAVYNKLYNEWVGHGASFSHSEIKIRNVASISYDLLNDNNIRCGAYVRTTGDSNGSYDGNIGHSIIILSYNTTYITYLEGNADGKGKIKITTYKWADFNKKQLQGHVKDKVPQPRWICHIVQPTEEYYNEHYSYYTPPAASTLTISPSQNSYTIMQGSKCNIGGSITSNYSITHVYAELDGTRYSDFIPNAKTVKLSDANTGKLNSFKGAKLSAGTHTIRIVAEDGHAAKEKSIQIVVNAPAAPAIVVNKPYVSESGSFVGGKYVTISGEGTTYYRINGGRDTVYTGEFAIYGTANIESYSVRSGVSSSICSTRITVEELKTPTVNTVQTPLGTRVVITDNSGAITMYKTDNGTYQKYTVPFVVTEDCKVSTYTYRSGAVTSATETKNVKVSVPSAPKIFTPANDYKIAQNGTVMLSWYKLDTASSYNIEVYKGEDLQSTFSTTATNYSFTLNDAGKYNFKVYAENIIGVSDNAAEIDVYSMPPVSVTFADYDGNILSKQEIDYGSSATAPPEPQRTGYYFQRWDKSFENITKDTTVNAVYKIITYTVNFIDQNGNKLGTQKIDYSSAANPEIYNVPIPVGRALYGWSITAESSNSKCDLNFIDSNMTAKAIVGLEDSELPFVTEIISAERGDGEGCDYAYNIKVKVTNASDDLLTGLLRVSLKSSDGKKMFKTESRTVALKAGQEKEFDDFTLKYKGTATLVEAVMLSYEDDTTGAACSKPDTANVIVLTGYEYGNWSEWSTEKPAESDIRQSESITQYRYSDKQYTSSTTSNSISGWTLYNTTSSSSGWIYNGANYVSPINSVSMRREVSSNYISPTYKTQYHYYRWWGPNSCPWTFSNSTHPYWEEIWLDYEMPYSKKASSGDIYKYYDNINYGEANNKYWLKAGPGANGYWQDYTRTVVASGDYYEYYYKDTYYTYYFYRWGSWSSWDNTVYNSGSERKVETRTLYRYRDKDVEVKDSLSSVNEDLNGETYSFTGKINTDIDLNGKRATIMVYKGKNSDPNESQLQYVGQTVLGENNIYDFSFMTKDAPSVTSGDYVVALSVQGSTGLINIGMIEAPKEEYEVKFLDINGNTLPVYDSNGNKVTRLIKGEEIQYVKKGEKVIIPVAPLVEGYKFITWSESGTNISANADISAIYVPEKYAVVFIDWVNGTAIAETYEYGTDLTDIAANITPTAKGYIFKGWNEIKSGKTTVTENMIISADFDAEKYTVKFHGLNGEIISEQQVEYGKSAILPDPPKNSEMIFLGWDNDETWWNVTENLDIYPIAMRESTTELTVNSEEYICDSSAIIEFETETGAVIYYTLDGSAPNPMSVGDEDSQTLIYNGEIMLDESTVVTAMATSDGKNNSELVCVCFETPDPYSSNDPTDLVEIGTYNVYTTPGKEITLQVELEDNPGLLGYLFTIECDKSIFNLDQDDSAVCTKGDVSAKGTLLYSSLEEGGWQVLWYNSEATDETGTLFSFKLHIASNADCAVYPIKVSYSPSNTITSIDNCEISCIDTCVYSDAGILLGDVSGDGYITTSDVIRIAKFLISDIELSDEQKLAADVTSDGYITNADVIRLARYIVGLAVLR